MIFKQLAREKPISGVWLVLLGVIIQNQLWAQPDLNLHFSWDKIQALPVLQDGRPNPGLAGAFSGVHNEVLIVAGGANFPDGGIWEGGSKVYHDHIYVLEENGDTYSWFEPVMTRLPVPVAYGLSIGLPEGVLCIGGVSDDGMKADVLLLKWDKGQIIIDEFPKLPVPMANLAGGLIGEDVYIAGISESLDKQFLRINPQNLGNGWEVLPAWGGPPRTHAVGVTQNDGEETCFYLIKGRINLQDGNPSRILSDIWKYIPTRNAWEPIETQDPFPLSAGTGIAMGANHILLFGGDDGRRFNRLEALNILIDSTLEKNRKDSLTLIRNQIMRDHPGFSTEIRSFHTVTQTWTLLDTIPYPGPVTTTALTWDNQIIIPSGEIAPCIRTPDILALRLEVEAQFGWINYGVVGGYLVLLIGLGFYFNRRQKTTEDFFKAGRRIPAWAAGLSIFGTQLSAITFMAVPAKTYATDWLYFFLMMTIIMVIPFIVHVFLPFYRRFNLTTAYEYLELRFNLLTRLTGSLMYILLQIGRLGIVMLLPALALSVVTGMDVYLCILAMGLLSIFYTVLGGIEAVIWTDVIQVVVLLGGALFSLGYLFFNLDFEIIQQNISDFNKMRIFDTTITFRHPTLWVVLIGGLASNIVQYGSDQTVIQRYLTTKDEQEAARSIRIGAWMALPSALIFFTLGTLLFVYYRENPDWLNPVLSQTDAIFPWFIVNSLPAGICGLLIAAIFAASMSSLDSSMNSVSTVITTDFFRRFDNRRSEADYLRVARMITVIIGTLGTGLALVMAAWGISSLWDQFNVIVGLFAGGLGGVFLLGIFFKRANGMGAFIGLMISGLIQYFVRESTEIHLLMYAFTGMISAILFGYVCSLFFQKPQNSHLKYTLSELKK